MSLEFNLSYAGIGFVADAGKIVRLSPEKDDGISSEQNPIRQQQPLPDLINELNRLIPSQYLQDFGMTPVQPGRNLASIAYLTQLGPQPGPDIRIGDWYYPNTASRWGVFRGLATSEQMKAMQVQAAASSPRLFLMQASPISPDNTQNDLEAYTVPDYMYMLPPRPLAELGGQFSGLFLITLVDERYYWQYNPVSLRVNQNTTWGNLLFQLATVLGVSIDFAPIQSVYMQPEADSQFWCNMESAAVLLDAIAYNIGRTVVRLGHGEYYLMTASESAAIVSNNRGVAERVIRTAGGDIFNSGTQALISGDLTNSKNFVIPSSVTVSFPKYVVGDDPVPHFLNSRSRNQRPSAWFEQSYGDTYDVNIPIGSAGIEFADLVGVQPYSYSIHSTAKALLEAESSSTPINYLQLLALAQQLANDFYNDQTAQALDEVYPGTYVWDVEGIHDIIWTFSSRARQATTRVMKTEWNEMIPNRQHSTPPPVKESQETVFPITYPQTNTPRGVGGLSVALNIRDSFSGSMGIVDTGGSITPDTTGGPRTTLAAAMLSTYLYAPVSSVNYFPTANRWRARIDDEVLLMEGTQGGLDYGCVDFDSESSEYVEPGYTLLIDPDDTIVYFYPDADGDSELDNGITICPAFADKQGNIYLYGGLRIRNGDTTTVAGGIVYGGEPQADGSVKYDFGEFDNQGTAIPIAFRGIDGTIATAHNNESTLQQLVPDTNYGTNLITFDKGQFVYPSVWTSGGIQGATVIPQIQSVWAYDGVSEIASQDEEGNDTTKFVSGGHLINGRNLYSGRVYTYDPTQTFNAQTMKPNEGPWVSGELIWIEERNNQVVISGQFYDGQLVNYSKSDSTNPVAPIYAVNAAVSSEGGGSTPSDQCCTPGFATYVNGQLTTIPCEPCFTPPVDYDTALAALQDCFGINFLSTPGTNVATWVPVCEPGPDDPPPPLPPECTVIRSSGTSPYDTPISTKPPFQFVTKGDNSFTSEPPGNQLINEPVVSSGSNSLINLPTCDGLKYYVSETPGIYFLTQHEEEGCITDVQAVISYPTPNSDTQVDGENPSPDGPDGTPGNPASPLNWKSGCGITVKAQGDPICNRIDITINWNGIKVYGTTGQTPTCNEPPEIDFQGFGMAFVFDTCDFSVQAGGVNANDLCDPLKAFSIKTKGYTGSFGYLKTDCTAGAVIIKDGLIKDVI